jgi:hypothetical protein
MPEITTLGKRKLFVVCGYTAAVLALCGWLLHADKISGSEFLQAVGITGMLVGSYLGANVVKGIWGK